MPTPPGCVGPSPKEAGSSPPHCCTLMHNVRSQVVAWPFNQSWQACCASVLLGCGCLAIHSTFLTSRQYCFCVCSRERSDGHPPLWVAAATQAQTTVPLGQPVDRPHSRELHTSGISGGGSGYVKSALHARRTRAPTLAAPCSAAVQPRVHCVITCASHSHATRIACHSTKALPSLAALLRAQILELSRLALSGPASQLQLPANVSKLFLDTNQLTGTIPDEWRSATQLAYVSLWGNMLTGGPPLLASMMWQAGTRHASKLGPP